MNYNLIVKSKEKLKQMGVGNESGGQVITGWDTEYIALLTVGCTCIFFYILGIIGILLLRKSVFIRQTIPAINVCITINYIINTITAFFTSRGPILCPVYLWAGFINVLPTIIGFYIIGLRWIIVDAISKLLVKEYKRSGESKDGSGESKDGSNESKDGSGESKDGSGESKDGSSESKGKDGKGICKNFSLINFLANKRSTGSASFSLKLYFISLLVSLIIPLIINLTAPVYLTTGLCDDRSISEIILFILIFIIAIVLFIYDIVKLRTIKDDYGVKIMLIGAITTWVLVLIVFTVISVFDNPVLKVMFKFFAVTIFIVPFSFLVVFPFYKHCKEFGFTIGEFSSKTDTDAEGSLNESRTEINITIPKGHQMIEVLAYQVEGSTERLGYDFFYDYLSRYDAAENYHISGNRWQFYRHSLDFFDQWMRLDKNSELLPAKANLLYQKFIQTKDGGIPLCPIKTNNPYDFNEVIKLWNVMTDLYSITEDFESSRVKTAENAFITEMGEVHLKVRDVLVKLFSKYKSSTSYTEFIRKSNLF